ncbi:MAG: hypothetical protein HXS50_00495 [Theionarchaea archaeon]|nr:hypothetical protein [Theionarchaea archaeon]
MKYGLFILVSLLLPSVLSVYDGELGDYFVLIDEETGTGYTLDEFLEMTASHHDWQKGGWDVNSRMTSVAKEIFWQINGAEPSELEDPMVLVRYLEEGVDNILSHYNPRDGLVGESGSDIVHRLGGTLKGTNIYWVMGMEHPYLKELADTLISNEKSGTWRIEANGRSTVPRNVVELVTLCLETTNYRRDELFWVLESVGEWAYQDFGTHDYTIQYAIGFVGTMLHWNNSKYGHPLWTRTRGLSYPYVLETNVKKWPDGKVKLVDNPFFLGLNESDWFDRRQTRVRMARRQEIVKAPWWAEGPHELWIDPEDGEDAAGEMGENIYRLRNMEPWEDGYRGSANIFIVVAILVVVALGILGFWSLRRG